MSDTPTVACALAALNVVNQYDGPREVVHTFLEGPFGPLGADWDRSAAEALVHSAAERGKLYYTTGIALSMGHGIAAIDEEGERVFLETKPGWQPPEREEG